ncbi:ABC transporter permease [Kitasatospora sp. NPDC004723]|uniref:ABC transporter permease n=1 Tax=Kitasatospora sp. NPDC004723 TaxID=3154288 RepID=UPI0033A01DB3
MRLRPSRPVRGAGSGRGSVEHSRLTPRDLVSEAVAGMLQRPARSALTALGTVLGVGTFVAVLGLTATTSSQIDSRFNPLTATEVTVEDVAHDLNPFAGRTFPADADDRVQGLNGVEHAGVLWDVRLGPETAVRSSPVGTVGGERIGVVAASPGAVEASAPHVVQGRLYDRYLADRAEPVAVIGSGVAARLGITTLETGPAVFIGDQPFTVVGIIDDSLRRPEFALSVLVPSTTAERVWGPPGAGERMLVSTRMGAARQIADEVPTALRPDHPEYLKSVPPPDPRTLRRSVTSDLNQLFLLLAGICLVIGAVGIANTTLVAVLERTGEIGLRRALGAKGRHITLQFLTESGALGVIGGLVGASLGAVTVVVVAVVREWTPVLDAATVAAAPLMGLLTGLLAGVYPSWRAARIQPAEALRR